MIVMFLSVVFLALGILVCVKHDVPHLYAKAQRVIGGLLFALVLSMGACLLFSAVGCSDVDPYWFYWYAMGCFLNAHSS